MKRAVVTLIGLIALAGCSGMIETSRIPDSAADAKATGLRYFLPQRVEVSVYHVTLKDRMPSDPNELRHRVDHVGDVITDTINDPEALWQVTYHGALFASQSVTLTLSDKGAVKSVGLTSSSSTSVGLGALQAIQKGLETQRDFGKTGEQAKIDELNRQTNLIKARKDLEDVLKGK